MKLLTLSFTIFILTSICCAQGNDLPVNDSIKINSNINSLEKLFYQLDEFEFFIDLTNQKRKLDFNNETARLLLKASIHYPAFGSSRDNTPEYLHSSLYDQYIENSKFNPVRTALGMIQAGAVGYLAYRHIKKWGVKK